MPTVGILGASGYAGAELLRLLALHPHFTPEVLCAETQAGVPVSALYPHLGPTTARFTALGDSDAALARCDLIFCALPHGKAMSVLPKLKNRVVIDLGGDFRLKDARSYHEWYGAVHACPAELEKWQYGLPELFREVLRGAQRVANPGCYATAAILAAAPLVTSGLSEGPVVIDAVSGTSGAGRTLREDMHFSHADENVAAYRIARHQHTPEIEAALRASSGKEAAVSLTAHLAPVTRGIHATCSAQLKSGAGAEELRAVFEKAYAGEPFVALSVEPPGTKEVRGTNRAVLSVHVDPRVRRVIVTSVLDNLVKGAAGQAIQNANLAFGYDETLGLPLQALYP